MPQCPTCNAAIWTGQRYCTICDRYLPNSGEEDRLCPRCHIGVGPHQKFCHKCITSLGETPGGSFSRPARVRRFFPWATGILIGVIIICFFHRAVFTAMFVA